MNVSSLLFSFSLFELTLINNLREYKLSNHLVISWMDV